jgi:hypothetical protein
MRLKILGILPFLTLSTLTGCAPHVKSICGRSGGQCCAVQPPGATSKTYYACIKDNVCPPHGISGTPTFPETNPPSGRCEVEYRDGWIWESNDSAVASIADLASQAAAFQAAPATIKDDAGKVLGIDDPGFCSALCSADDQIGRCPRAIIPNDVSTGIVSLAVDLAEKPNAPDQIITMDDLVKRFNATQGAMSCQRDPIIYAGGSLDNSGTQCITLVSANKGAIKADFTVKTVIHSDVKSVPKVASFSNPDQTMNIKVNDDAWNKLVGGNIQTAARIASTDIAAKTANDVRKSCIRMRPRVVEDRKLDDVVDGLERDPSIVARAVGDIKALKLSFSNLPAEISQTDAGYPQLMPISEQLKTLATSATASAAGTYRSKQYAVTAKSRAIVLRPEDVAVALDMYVCSAGIGTVTYSDYDRFFPTIVSALDATAELMETRDRLAGKLLLCTYGAERLSPTVREALKQGIAELNSP